MKKLDLYKLAFNTAQDLLDTPGGAPLDAAIATTGATVPEKDYPFFKQQVTTIRAQMLQYRTADEQAEKQAAAKPTAAKTPATPAK